MKKKRRLRAFSGFMAFAFVFMVFSFSFAPKAHAEEVSLSVTYGVRSKYEGTNQVDGYTPIHNSTVSLSRQVIMNGTDRIVRVTPYIITDGNYWHTGPCKIYFSWYPIGNIGTYAGLPETHSDYWVMEYDNDRGERIEETGITSQSTFSLENAPALAFGLLGYACEAAFVGSPEYPITRLAVGGNLTRGYGYYSIVIAGAEDNTQLYPDPLSVGAHFISIRVVSTETTAELELLDTVSNQLIQQNDLLLSMKGEIVALLQDIYEMTGDIWIAQDLANQYLASMLNVLNNIDNTTVNIYNLLVTQLQALETAINTSASTIEAAIEAQTAAMIAYLDEMFNTGNEVPDETYEQQQDAENILDLMESLEKPDVETIVPDIGDIGNDDISGVLSSIFSSNLIVTMMTLSASLAFGAYVLFGKRG